MPVNGSARAIATGIIGIRDIEALERRQLVVQRAADMLVMMATLAEAKALIKKRVDPREAAGILAHIEAALGGDAGARLNMLLMHPTTTIEDMRAMFLGEEQRKAVPV